MCVCMYIYTYMHIFICVSGTAEAFHCIHFVSFSLKPSFACQFHCSILRLHRFVCVPVGVFLCFVWICVSFFCFTVSTTVLSYEMLFKSMCQPNNCVNFQSSFTQIYVLLSFFCTTFEAYLTLDPFYDACKFTELLCECFAFSRFCALDYLLLHVFSLFFH